MSSLEFPPWLSNSLVIQHHLHSVSPHDTPACSLQFSKYILLLFPLQTTQIPNSWPLPRFSLTYTSFPLCLSLISSSLHCKLIRSLLVLVTTISQCIGNFLAHDQLSADVCRLSLEAHFKANFFYNSTVFFEFLCYPHSSKLS